MVIARTLFTTLTRHKARMALLLFSIAACASLLFANIGFQRTCEQMVYDADTRWCGDAELYIAPRQAAGAEEWIPADLLDPYRGELEYAYGMVRCKALYAPDGGGGDGGGGTHYFTALGVDIREFDSYNPLALQSGSTDGWTGYRLVMGETYAKRLGVSVGDSLALEINGEQRGFLVAGISEPKGLFLRELADGGYLLMPRETMEGIAGGECNLVFLKTKDPASVPAFKQTLADAFPGYAVNMGIDHAVIRAETNNYVLPFWFSSILVVFMSVFIIYTSFNLIVNERMGMLGILRSVGCSRKRANRILVLESAAIGLAGGAFGCLLGTGVLYAIKNVYFSGEAAVINAPMAFGAYEVFFTLAAAAAITVLSAMLPIVKATRVPIKNIILNDYQKQKMKDARLWPLGIALLLPCILAPVFAGRGFSGMAINSAAASLALIGLTLLIPALCRLAALAAGRASYETALGARNTGDFKALVNNTRLVAATIAIMVFMMTLFSSLGADLKNYYKRDNYDIQLELRRSGPEPLARLSGTDGVVGFVGIYDTFAAVNNYGTFLNEVIGIDDDSCFEYLPAGIPADARAALGSLSDGRNIVTSFILRDKLGLGVGDTLTLQLEGGSFDYRVTGFVDTNRAIGHLGYISSENFKADTGVEDYTFVYVKADGEPGAVKGNIQKALSKDVLSAQTKAELEAANADKVVGVFNAINAYAWFAMLIGVLGIVNNMTACFLGRRRNLALYRCIGMTRKGAARMLVAEAGTIGIVGVLAGLCVGMLMMGNIPFLVGMFWGNVTVAVPAVKIVGMCAAGVAAMFLCSLIPLAGSRKLSIMDSLRYE